MIHEIYKPKEKCLIEIEIQLEYGDNHCVQFFIYDNKFVWCFELPVAEELNKMSLFNHQLPINELIEDEILKEQFQTNVKYNQVVLTENLKEELLTLYKDELNDMVDKPHGLDGFSYVVRINKNKASNEYRCWCKIPVEWFTLREIINEIIDLIKLPEIYKPC